MIHTVFDFTLPKGYVAECGTLYRHGQMRLATAADEILPLRDPRCRENEAYLIILLLARVITKLGPFDAVTPPMVENFFRADLAYLQEFYNRINEVGQPSVPAVCPACEHGFTVGLDPAGGSSATPSPVFARR